MHPIQNILKLLLTFKQFKIERARTSKTRPENNSKAVKRKIKSSFTRNFSKAMYHAADWLCGCEVKNAILLHMFHCTNKLRCIDRVMC